MSSPAVLPLSRPTIWSRIVLFALAVLFVAGAVGQFFLAGLSVFDTPLRWSDHATLGHTLGLVAYVAWIPAVLGRVGRGLIVGSVLLGVLFGFQYAFAESNEPSIQALHPLNGAVMFALALWLGRRTFAVLRRGPRERTVDQGQTSLQQG